MGRSRGVVDRDVIDVIVDFRRVLNEARPDQCPDIAAEYLCDLFDGSATALNLMDYGNVRFQTIRNVGHLSSTERHRPIGEYYPFSDFPFSAQQLAHGGAYRAALADPSCPPEYRELLGGMRRTDCLGAPIRHTGKAIGELWVTRNTGRSFTDAEENLAVACGATLARFFRPTWAIAG
ncbi:MAG: GAF domain-containing protein [Actinomycetes bacterium]